jgi:hypothetical protein
VTESRITSEKAQEGGGLSQHMFVSYYGRREGRLTLEEELEDTSGLLVDQSRDSLDSSSSCQSSDRRLGDTLDVVSKDLREDREEQEGQYML